MSKKEIKKIEKFNPTIEEKKAVAEFLSNYFTKDSIVGGVRGKLPSKKS